MNNNNTPLDNNNSFSILVLLKISLLKISKNIISLLKIKVNIFVKDILKYNKEGD